MTKRFFDMYPGMESRVKMRGSYYSEPENKEIWDVGFESNEEECLLRWSRLVKRLMKKTHPTVEEVTQSKKRTIWTTESTKPKSKMNMNKKKLRVEGWRDCKRDDHF
jgi:hypothetical protein